jgi:Cu(I)/Ag(I) efflux system membrane fusion protein
MKNVRLALLALVLVATGFTVGRWRAAPAGGASQATAQRYQCPMHPAIIQDHPGDCPVCGMKPVPVRADGAGPSTAGAARPAGTVTLDAGKRQLQGVRVGTVEKAAASRALRLFGRVVPDETRVHTLNAALDGSMARVAEVTTGSRVRRGQWLGSVFMLEARAALQAYITALDVVELDPRQRADQGMTVVVGTTPGKSAQFSEERLRSYGVSQRQIEEIHHKREIPMTIDVYAPVEGFVLSRNVTPGKKFMKGEEWFRIANLDTIWVLADLPDADAALVRPGQKATVTLPGHLGTLPAVVSDVPPQFDPESSTLKVRLLVENPGAVLRPDMFVDVDLAIERPAGLTVPVDAVVDGGLRKTVFVEKGDGVFEPRRVETGVHLGDRVEIVQGLSEGDRIVVSGTFMVDSESQLRAAAAGFSSEPAKDPICGMDVDEAKARAAGKSHQHGGKTYFFCSEQCRKTFAASPEAHLGAAGGRGAGQGGGPGQEPGHDHGHEHGRDRGGANAQDHGRRQASL